MDATAQTITAVTAHVVNNRDKFDTAGKRALFLVEELIQAAVLPTKAGTPQESSAIGAALAAHVALEVRSRDIKRVVMVVRASLLGDKLAKEAVDGLRSGGRTTGDAAYSHWKRAGKRARGRRGRTFISKNVKLSDADRAWVVSKARALKKGLKTGAQRAVAMNKAIIERGLASLNMAGGPTSSLEVRTLIAKELGIRDKDLGSGMTILRREATGEITPGAIEAIEEGHFKSCTWVLKEFTGPGRRAYIEKVKSEDWLRKTADAIASNAALVVLGPSAMALKYLETLIEHKALDPAAQVSRQAKTIFKIATNRIPGVSCREVEACFTMLRAIARKELPPHALSGIRSGVETASTITGSRVGGVAGLAREYRTKRGEAAPVTSVADVDLCVATTLVSADPGDEIEDPVAALHDFASSSGREIDKIIAAAEAKRDKEPAALANQIREHIGFLKMQVSKLRARRSAKQTGSKLAVGSK